jgi:poly(A) polymerase
VGIAFSRGFDILRGMDATEPLRTGNHRITPELIDPDAYKVLRRLNQFEHHAYLVGGAVRDILLSKAPKDFDIATSARPNDVRKLFRNCRLIGRRFRLAHICFTGGKIIEVATFRAAPDHDEDGPIRDDNEFGSPESDAYRRDFTVNALFYDLETDEIIDYCGGLADLAERRLRTIGDPVVRFREDPVRMLRAIKFCARLDLTLDASTRRGILTERSEIRKAAIPRLYEEIVRMLWQGAAARSFELMADLGLLELLLPEIAGFLGRGAEDPWLPLKPLLEALDLRHEGVQTQSGGMLLAVLFWPLFQAVIADLPEPPSKVLARRLAESIVAPFAVRLRIPRRHLAVLVSALAGQVRIDKPFKRPSARVSFARNPNFGAIADLFALRCEVEDIDPELVSAMRSLAKDAVRLGPEEDEFDDDRRRRRRRR